MRKAIAILIPAFLLSGLVSVGYGGLYRWVDKDGNVHYSDSIPPDQVESGHTELGKAGVRVKAVPRAKTPEELQKERELERLRAEREKLLEEQRAADRVLLKTFSSEDDIYMARDGKIAAIDVLIDVTKNKILRKQKRLPELLAGAADLERAGKQVHENLTAGIGQVEQSVRNSYAEIIALENQKDSIREKFERDVERFRQLKHLPVSDSPLQAGTKRPILHNIVVCADAPECGRLWEKAAVYVRRHATTAVQTSNDLILITAPPATERDTSLILARINDKEGPGASLFLDLQCQRTIEGKEFCKSEEAQAIIRKFRPALTGKDAPRP